MKVLQEIPDGKLCGGSCNAGCIFLDEHIHDYEGRRGPGCRRYPEYSLALMHSKKGTEVLKCPPCLAETDIQNTTIDIVSKMALAWKTEHPDETIGEDKL